jgi:hypothetical protein
VPVHQRHDHERHRRDYGQTHGQAGDDPQGPVTPRRAGPRGAAPPGWPAGGYRHARKVQLRRATPAAVPGGGDNWGTAGGTLPPRFSGTLRARCTGGSGDLGIRGHWHLA